MERRKAGHPTSGRTPYGYRWVHAPDRDAHGTRYRVDAEEAGVIHRVFDEFLAGATLGQIASDLNADGYKTRNGARWHSPTIRRLLINPHLAGLLPPVQPEGQDDMAKVDITECTPGAWPAIVDVDKLLAARGRLVGVKPVHSGTARKWLLSGLAVCGVCGGPVRSARAATHPTPRVDGSGLSPKQYHAVYRCVTGHFVRKGAMIDEFVKEVCIERLSRPDAHDLLIPKSDGPDLGVLTARRAELQSRDETLASMFVKGRISKTALDTGLDELAEELRAVDEQIAALVGADPLADALSGDGARAWWESDSTTLARRRAVVETLMTVVIHRVGNGRRVTTIDEAPETISIEWKQPTAGSDA
nr:recombinase family protein [Brachybacterium halotolerans]